MKRRTSIKFIALFFCLSQVWGQSNDPLNCQGHIKALGDVSNRLENFSAQALGLTHPTDIAITLGALKVRLYRQQQDIEALRLLLGKELNVPEVNQNTLNAVNNIPLLRFADFGTYLGINPQSLTEEMELVRALAVTSADLDMLAKDRSNLDETHKDRIARLKLFAESAKTEDEATKYQKHAARELYLLYSEMALPLLSESEPERKICQAAINSQVGADAFHKCVGKLPPNAITQDIERKKQDIQRLRVQIALFEDNSNVKTMRSCQKALANVLFLQCPDYITKRSSASCYNNNDDVTGSTYVLTNTENNLGAVLAAFPSSTQLLDGSQHQSELTEQLKQIDQQCSKDLKITELLSNGKTLERSERISASARVSSARASVQRQRLKKHYGEYVVYDDPDHPGRGTTYKPSSWLSHAAPAVGQLVGGLVPTYFQGRSQVFQAHVAGSVYQQMAYQDRLSQYFLDNVVSENPSQALPFFQKAPMFGTSGGIFLPGNFNFLGSPI